MAKHIATGTPTQVAHPGKATLRTAAAVIVAALIAVVGFGPLIIDAIIQEPIVPETLRGALLAVSAVLVALGAIFTRIMAIPGINDLLQKIGFGTGVEKEPDPDLLEDSVAAQFYAAGYPIPEPHEPTTADTERYEQ
ncbi:hypothetical protein FQ154_01540 [Paeniglutamicibacter gangotriensis]|uniref:Uncharacterized protein n=1 Tax=Paeniglutamicibacter gangotriensis TaxID=254787 RepID=A0A5B0EMJ5_9MICC|nr:hypothetical protein [Paeniglutamicibacter gangotriensis]KAA0979868.1 hypothetical protein FQ154_01540 [Paeniglutamicibacter gangotriensis]